MPRKNFAKILIQCFLFIILLEVFLRVVFYQQVGRERLAVLEIARNIKRKIYRPGIDRVYNGFLIARPDSTKETNRLIAEEAANSNYFEYTAWTEYKNIDFSGKYINTNGMVRKTMPDTFINQDTTAIEVIYFLGGSTMYGVNVTDRETIASAFVNAYQQQFPRGVSIKVVNYGIPAYHSYNELMLLSHLVYSGRSPGVVIMLDGLNDFLMPVAAKERLPYYYYRLKLASKDKISFKELAQIADSTETLYTSPAGYTAKALTDSLVKNYLSNLNQVNKLSVSNGFKAFCFIQPNPFYNYPNKKHDPVCDQLEYPLVTSGYALLASRSSSVENCFFLGNMLANEKGFPFIDRFHYSPEMCKRIAAELVGVVGERINKP